MIWIISVWLLVGCFFARATSELTTTGGWWTMLLLWPLLLVYTVVALLWELVAWLVSDHDKKEGQP